MIDAQALALQTVRQQLLSEKVREGLSGMRAGLLTLIQEAHACLKHRNAARTSCSPVVPGRSPCTSTLCRSTLVRSFAPVAP